MTADRTAVVSCRVSDDLRAGLEYVAELERHCQISIVVRKALEAYVRGELGNIDDAALRGSHRRSSGPTEVAAALKTAPRVGTMRRRILELYAESAEGLTANDVCVVLDAVSPHVAVNGAPRRVTDLVQGGLIAERTINTDENEAQGRVYTRQTRHGARARVYQVTEAGIEALRAARAREEALQ